MALNLVVREYLKKMLMEAGSGMKVLLVDQDTVGTQPLTLHARARSHAPTIWYRGGCACLCRRITLRWRADCPRGMCSLSGGSLAKCESATRR
jgi:hypothetical protein